MHFFCIKCIFFADFFSEVFFYSKRSVVFSGILRNFCTEWFSAKKVILAEKSYFLIEKGFDRRWLKPMAIQKKYHS
ncbi:hypothetical protein AB674_11680 [Flavobacterium sp. ABG]|nr:hypothetical protein AB674_11680 [Flavobacterium sp. ABG]